MKKADRLSEKSIKVLTLIATGHSYSQIVEGNPGLNYHDIFLAAEEAVWVDEKIGQLGQSSEMTKTVSTGKSAMERSKEKYPRAYSPWSESEDAELIAMDADGKSKTEIAAHFQRQLSAVQSRRQKLGLA